MPLLFVFRSGPLIASSGDMRAETIDFISAYCDRWCERCAFTDRCSAFACDAAIAMCGDAAEGIELAVGRPRSPERSSAVADGESFLEDFLNQVPSDEEMAEFKRLENVRRARVDASPISQMARTFMKHATEWIDGHRSLDEDADPIVREAFRIACWDAYFIYVKLCRALSGRDSRIQALADGLGHLQESVLVGFPKATEFRRPGFDDPAGGEYAFDLLHR